MVPRGLALSHWHRRTDQWLEARPQTRPLSESRRGGLGTLGWQGDSIASAAKRSHQISMRYCKACHHSARDSSIWAAVGAEAAEVAGCSNFASTGTAALVVGPDSNSDNRDTAVASDSTAAPM